MRGMEADYNKIINLAQIQLSSFPSWQPSISRPNIKNILLGLKPLPTLKHQIALDMLVQIPNLIRNSEELWQPHDILDIAHRLKSYRKLSVVIFISYSL